ncbi:MAG: hypothetical protein WCH11_07395, partial [Bdellovibrio sp.]
MGLILRVAGFILSLVFSIASADSGAGAGAGAGAKVKTFTRAGTEYPRAEKAPKLSLILVIDQLRSDQLSRFQSRFLPESEKGLLFLMKQGAYFPSADFGIFQNMTCPGHAVILTG